uniref:DNA-directed DNA polymerase n=2 Tax=Meloidogyne hapla TaxID=6305 RepID=A0A1I8BI55_MELHA
MNPRKRKNSSDISTTPRKFSRNYFIDNLLFGVQQQQQGSGDKTTSDYVELLSNDIDHITKFNVIKSRSKFLIKDIPADPEELLSSIFHHCIDEALEASRSKGLEPEKLGCTITSELLESDIWVPIRELNSNTVDSILNLFLKVAQSKKQSGVSLWGKPFNVTTTVLDKSRAVEVRRLTGGANGKTAPVHHQIKEHNLIKINNSDTFCLFYSLLATLIFAIKKYDKRQFYDYLHGRYGWAGKFKRETTELMNEINAPLNMGHYDAMEWIPPVVDLWNKQYEGQFAFKAFVFGSIGRYEPLFKYGASNYDTPLLLYYYNNEHFHGVKEPGGLFGRPYCLSCEKVYHRPSNHAKTCKARCLKCSRVGPKYPCEPDGIFFKKCKSCLKNFNNNNCFLHHISSKFCNRSKRCEKCGVIWDVPNNTKDGRKGHVCNELYCKTCNDFHDPKRGCFIRPLEPKELAPYRIIAFDLETTQHVPEHHDNKKRKHNPNFIAAKISCPKCIDNCSLDCKLCGEERLVTFSEQPFTKTTVDRQIITSDPLEAFVSWIVELTAGNSTYAFSHFGGRFDMVIVFRMLFLRGYTPSIINNGNKLYEMKLQIGKKSFLIFRDSFNLMPMSLASLVPAFELNVEDKPYFPHRSNRPDNYGKEIFPEPSDYFADGMMPEKRRAFDKWYEENNTKPFNLEESLASYCTNDVEILMAALIAFRREFLEVTKREAGQRAASSKAHNGIDVLREARTIASGCMKHFRTNHLKERHLGLVPERGYDNADNQSKLALKFLNWYAAENNVNIRTAYSDGGEKKIGKYRVDGWIDEQRLCIEVNGCVWHGCSKCYPHDNTILPNGKTAGKQREHDKIRLDFIQQQNVKIEVFVIPPKTIDVPVLPMKLEGDERLLFTLCASCARKYPTGDVLSNYNCTHTDLQRGWVATATSLELGAALEEGYIVTKLFRVLEYTSSDDKLFAPYIREFMAQKIHSSGFDANIKGDEEKEEKFIKECKDLFGINIERSKMVPNKGKRTQAKLMLNNLWGRFSLRNFGLSQSLVTDDSAEYCKYKDDPSVELSGVDELKPGILLLRYVTKKDWVEEHDSSNVVVSLWTTSAARLHLLRAMQKVVRTPGCSLLYTDTDSLIFSHPTGVCPLHLGPHLGEFTDEYPSHDILEFCCGGSKQYGLKLRRKEQRCSRAGVCS